MSTQTLNPNGINFTPTIHNDTYPFVSPAQFNLTNLSVLITGASKGIGRETALAYARAGTSQIAIAARSSLTDVQSELLTAAKTAGRTPPKVLPLQLDVTDYDAVAAAAEKVEAEFGKLDIVISNAGFLEPFTPFTQSNPAEWKRSYEINVFGVYHIARAFVPLLQKTRGQLLNLSSIGAHVVMPGGSGYQTTKLAVLRFSEFIGTECPEVLGYAVHPGGVLTDLAKGMGKENERLLIDQPALAADTMVWLTAERRDWLAGRYVSVTWDMKELLEKRKKIEDEDLLKVRMAVGGA